MQAYEVPQASAHALLGVDYSSTLQALDTPLLVLPMPEDTLQSQHAAAATPEPSCVFSSPSAAQSHDSPPSHEVPSRQVSASQPGKRKQPDALCQLYAAPGPIAEQLSAALAQTEQAGSGRPLATQQHPAAANQRSQAKEEGRPGMGGGSRIRCVLLVPCCEAVHGRFPLNGTYFQINEVFLDAATLQHPVMASPLLDPQPCECPATGLNSNTLLRCCLVEQACTSIYLHGACRWGLHDERMQCHSSKQARLSIFIRQREYVFAGTGCGDACVEAALSLLWEHCGQRVPGHDYAPGGSVL